MRNPAVYDAVRRRASTWPDFNVCEACGVQIWVGVCDHFFGRARAHSVETVWLLCDDCDRRKTANQPSAGYWLCTFISHCEAHGYDEAAERARKRLQGIVKMREGR